MNKDGFSYLTPVAKSAINKLKRQGWIFENYSWEDHHTGVPYDDVKFKSPNMRDFGMIYEYRLNEITEDYLLERDAWHSAHDWAENVFTHTSVIIDPLAEGLEKYFLEKKNTNLKKLYATSAEFVVKISPKIKDSPKKIKVTIEII